MKVLYRILADATIVVHFLFIVFVLFGGFLAFRNKRWAYVHLPAVLWGATIEFMGWICPLTHLENWFLQKAGAEIYQGNFIEHYLALIIYPPSITHKYQIIYGSIVVVVNLLVYWRLMRKIFGKQ